MALIRKHDVLVPCFSFTTRRTEKQSAESCPTAPRKKTTADRYPAPLSAEQSAAGSCDVSADALLRKYFSEHSQRRSRKVALVSSEAFGVRNAAGARIGAGRAAVAHIEREWPRARWQTLLLVHGM